MSKNSIASKIIQFFSHLFLLVRPLMLGLILLISVFVVSVFGYMYLEGWNFLDSVYMVVITLSTVGFGEVHKLSPHGRIFTCLVLFVGLGIFAFVIGKVSQFIVEGAIFKVRRRQKMQNAIAQLKNHCIVCGYGRIGKVVVDTLKEENIPIVIIDNNIDHVEIFERLNLYYIIGDATLDDVLISSGIERAAHLVTVLTDDAANVYVTLSGRQLNNKIYIVARSSESSHHGKFVLAGANKILLPYHISGVTVAQAIIRPNVTSFIEMTRENKGLELLMEELLVTSQSSLVGKTLANSPIRKEYNLIVIGVKKIGKKMIFNPPYNYVIQENDIFIAVGSDDGLVEIQKIL